ncbi:hypothetical protein DMI60_19195 [Escherichia coli]|nr:hypothetical protein [Escherichia coli]
MAVIGAGPAGLGCADILARAGVQVDVSLIAIQKLAVC